MRVSLFGLVVVLAGGLVACGSGAGSSGGNGSGGDGGSIVFDGDGGSVPQCATGVDFDSDGYGEGCEAGPDCDDSSASVHDNCPDAGCASGPAQGCACDPATAVPVSCFEGPGAAAGNAPCEKGTRTCDPTTSTWGACGGQVLPTVEVCDTVDNDCDGEVDDGVLSMCGNCVPGCTEGGLGDDPFPSNGEPGVESEGVGLDPNGDLILDTSELKLHYLWVANDYEGTVSKINTRTGKEVARYASVTHESVVDHAGGRAFRGWNESLCGGAHADNRPSRTAIDLHGNAWVANRAHDCGGLQPSATKFFNAEVDCLDRNGNGVVDTSRDLDGSGTIELGTAEFLGESDECIHFTAVLGAAGGVARALAVGRAIEPNDPGSVWVGMYNEQAFYQLDGRTGALLQRTPETGALGVSAYGAAIDSRGHLWAPHGCCGNVTLLEINTNVFPSEVVGTVALPALGYAGSYGITIDLEDRVWVGGYPNSALKRYDPATGETVIVGIPGAPSGTYVTRGAGIDRHGNVWAAVHTIAGAGAWVARFDADTATNTGIWDMGGTVATGVGVDFDGDVWSVNQSTSNASRLHIDQVTLEPAAHATTGNTVDTFGVGQYPYTYSDFTGLGARIVTNPQGDFKQILQGCADEAKATWLSVEWETTTPANTSVEVWVRAGDDLATLDAWPTYGPWVTSPADLSQAPGPVPEATYLQLIIILKSDDGEATPIVHGYNTSWACPGVPIP